jgi:DNA-binding NarL/FixJ family response regulator
MNIVIIDKSELSSMRISSILSKVKGVKNIVQILDIMSILPTLEKMMPDAIIFDININGSDPFKLLKEIGKLLPDALIITLTSFSVEQYRKKCREMGIENCLDKTSEFEQIPKIISDFLKSKIKK